MKKDNQPLSSFDLALKNKIEHKPSSKLDHLFYNQLEELPAKRQTWLEYLKSNLRREVLVPALASATVCFILIASVLQLERPEFAANRDNYSQIVQIEEALENIELMSELEDLPTSEEDWELLLGALTEKSDTETQEST